MITPRDRDLDLYLDPLEPFTLRDTLRSALLLWPVSVVHMSAWLAVFMLLDRTLLPGRRVHQLARFASRRVTDLLGVRVRQRGLENVRPGQSYVFCMNHVSLLDTPVFVQSVPLFCRSFQDRAHFRIPIYGGLVRVLGQLPVDRKDKALNQQSFEQARDRLRAGESFAVFPEGHRTRDGRLGDFFPGAFRLAVEAGVPVLPVAVRGLRNLCPAGEWRIRPGTVEVLFGAPIPTTEAEGIEELARRTREAMNQLLWG